MVNKNLFICNFDQLMKKFLYNLACFCLTIIFVVVCYFVYYQHLDSVYNKVESTYAIYSWGDSQLKAGLDLQLISKLTNKKVHSAAGGGSGVYDSLVFIEHVPSDSRVILSISNFALMRNRD